MSHFVIVHSTVGSTVRVIVTKTLTLVRFYTEHAREAKTASVLFTHTNKRCSRTQQKASAREGPQELQRSQSGEGISRAGSQSILYTPRILDPSSASEPRSLNTETFFGPIARRRNFSSANLCRAVSIFPPSEGAIDRSIIRVRVFCFCSSSRHLLKEPSNYANHIFGYICN